MDDLEDIAEGLFEIEDIFEEILEPDELLEDLVSNTIAVAFALLAGFAALLTLLVLAVTVALLVVSSGSAALVAALVTIAVLSLFLTVLAVVGFLYFRPSIPSEVRDKIDSALARADDEPEGDGSMTEEEAIEELKQEYANGNIEDHELDQALDDALTSDNPETVVERYR
jgi:membrane protein implicated in regulation of membrane protease activity